MLSPRYYIFFAIILCAIAFGFIKQTTNDDADIIQSPQDERSYQYYQLANGLKVLLVSTPDSKQASAAVSVDVGSGDNPKERLGLAHFLEHMLFLGTKPYPSADEYQSYISQHGGFNNAFTAYRQTTYYFEIDNQALEGALDRFAPFFISPLFSEKYLERERKAVHAEYKAKFRDDYRRIYAATKQAFNPEHPYSQFAVGSLDTLSNTDKSLIRDDVIEFYNKHYSADKMSLVIAGNYPLSQLKEWADTRFADIAKRDLEPRSQPEPLFKPEKLPAFMQIKPIKNLRSLNFIFPMPEIDSLYAQKPLSFIAHLLGHEGQGSLLALLKEKGWAETLGAGAGFSTEFVSTLNINISLTEEGVKHIDEITQALFYYSKLMQNIPAYLLKEQQALNQLAFRFHEKKSLSQTLIELSSHLLRYPAKDVLYANYRQEAIPKDTLQTFLSQVNKNNMLRVLVAPKAQTKQTEKWYQTPYSLSYEPLKQGALTANELKQMHLPKPNPFVPESLTLNPSQEQSKPELLQESKYLSAWYYPEHSFKTPKTNLFVAFNKQQVRNQLKAQVLTSLMVRTLNEALNPYSYPAALAGLSYRLSATQTGMELAVSGYQEKLPVLLEEILSNINNISINKEEFLRYKQSLKRELENIREQSPYQNAINEFKRATAHPSFNEQGWLEALAEIDQQELSDFAQNFGEQIHSTVLIHAADNKKQAQKLVNMIEQYLPANATKIEAIKSVELPHKAHQKMLNLPHNDRLYSLYIQGKNSSDKLRASYALLGSIISTPYYQTLRTEQQRGYIVFATQYPQRNIPGLFFLVQSPKYSPEQISQATTSFFKDFAKELNNLSQEEFSNHQQGLINRLLEPPKNMSQKAGRFWQEINQPSIEFNKRQQLAQAIKETQLKQIQNLYKKVVLEKDAGWLFITQGEALKNMIDFKSLEKQNLNALN